MTVTPDGRTVRAAATWTGAAVLAVFWPPLTPVLVGAFAVLLALVLWDARLLARTPPLTVTRRLPARAFVGRDAELTIEVRSPRAADVEIEVVDELPSDLAAVEQRFAGVQVPAGGVVTLRHVVRPTARGDRALGPVIVLEASPLRFLRRRLVACAGDSLRVYPDATRFLSADALRPERRLAALGVRPMRKRGEGMEFESLRDYVPGDDPRRIDWAATARRGRPVTRLYQHERNHTVLIALDASRLMASRVADRTKLDHAVDGALGLTCAALAAGDRVGVVVFDREVRAQLAPRGHRRQLGVFVELLRTVEARLVEADYEALVRGLAGVPRQRALLIVLTDFVEADPVFLIAPLALLARRHRVLLVALRDPAYEALRPGADTGDPLDLYRRLVLDELLRDRESALGRLRRCGLDALDVESAVVTPALLNRYLKIRYAEGW